MEPATKNEFTLGPHGNNLFFEFDPIRGGIVAETPATPSDPRGIWVVGHGNRIWCRLFAKAGDHDSEISATFGHWFDFQNGEITPAGDTPGSRSDDGEFIAAERQLLGIVLSLLLDVSHGRRNLKPNPLSGYLTLDERLIAFD
jgi:hypothetical protein